VNIGPIDPEIIGLQGTIKGDNKNRELTAAKCSPFGEQAKWAKLREVSDINTIIRAVHFNLIFW